MNNPLDLFAWKVRSERKRRHLTQKQLAERLGMNPRTIIDLETCQSNPKFETVVLVAKELNISVDAAIFPEMVKQTVSKTVVDFFAGKSEAEIEKYIALCKQAEPSRKTSNTVEVEVPGCVILFFYGSKEKSSLPAPPARQTPHLPIHPRSYVLPARRRT